MRTSHVSYGFLIACILTIALAPTLTTALITMLSVTSLLAVVIFFLGHRHTACVTIACTTGVVVGLVLMTRTLAREQRQTIEHIADSLPVTMEGTVVDAPDKRPTVTKLTVQAETLIWNDGRTEVVRGNVLVNDVGGWPEYRYGDRIRAQGVLEKPTLIDRFDYDSYLRVRGISLLMQRARVESMHDARSDVLTTIFRTIYACRTWFEERINRVQIEPEASLLAGLLTGSRRGIPKRIAEDFRASGITHIVAISGYNITIILSLLSSLLFFLPLKRRFPILVSGIVLFTIFVGGSPSVVRACIMGILGLLALQTNRKATIRLTILWTAFFMLCHNPLLLRYDAGFQLSFLAVIGIAELTPMLTKLLRCVPTTMALRDSLIATLAAQIATLPLTVILFRQVSLVAPITNLLVAPLLPIAMLLGFLGAMLGIVSLPLGLICSYVAWLVLHGIILIASLCASVPFSTITW